MGKEITGSEIENVHTGSGDDTIIANSLSNVIKSGDGADLIFAGENEDITLNGSSVIKIWYVYNFVLAFSIDGG